MLAKAAGVSLRSVQRILEATWALVGFQIEHLFFSALG
jgi:hypothetical protein